MSFTKRLTVFVLILLVMIMFVGLLPGIARSAQLRRLARSTATTFNLPNPDHQ